MIRSDLAGFYRLPMARRRQKVAELTGLGEEDLRVLSGEEGLCAEQANHMVENALGVTNLPLGLCANLTVNGEDRLVPMAIEEPSVVAAASHASKLLRAGGGVTCEVSPAVMIGQVQLLEVPDAAAAEAAILGAEAELLEQANLLDPFLVQVGGGARGLELRHLPPRPGDPLGPMLVVHLLVDVKDAMGANTVNTMAEHLAPELERLSGGRSRLRIVSNLASHRTVRVSGLVPFAALENKGGGSGEALARGIEEASVFAERDPYRAATHNKGIMNGVDAVLLAFGQDWRAVEAGAHAFAARGGEYTALAIWRVEEAGLRGTMELPMPVGVVGGITAVHPTVRAALRLAGIRDAADLASLTAAVGLAQNLGALRALAAEGIQKGHMRVHARNVATSAGAVGPEVDKVARIIAERGQINAQAAARALKHVRAEPTTSIPVADMHGRLQVLRETYLEQILGEMQQVLAQAHPGGSSLVQMCTYHLETGGKRVRAILPLLVCEALGVDPAPMLPFGAACEMLHNATLVHEDLQDRSPLRRGRPAVWSHFGRTEAVNLGDAMLYYTLMLINRLEVPPARRQVVARRAVAETLRVLDGQEQERRLCETEAPALADYFAMVDGKASGLFALPMAGAAELCGSTATVVAGLHEAARHLGVLFQLQNDVMALYGPDAGDEGKGGEPQPIRRRNLLVVRASEKLSPAEAAELRGDLDLRDGEALRRVRALVQRQGSLAFALDELQRRRQAALSLPSLADHRRVGALLEAMCDVLLEPIRGAMAQIRARTRSAAV